MRSKTTTLWPLLRAWRLKRWQQAVLRPEAIKHDLNALDAYAAERDTYAAMPGAEVLHAQNDLPCLHDKMDYTPIDAHYAYQAVWAIRKLAETKPPHHVDVGSLGLMVGMFTAITDVEAVDIRPLSMDIPNLTPRKGSLLDLPHTDGSVASISCLHVVEHVGLGRYGDPLDPKGTEKSLRELARVVAPGGRLLLSTPIGKPRVCFNAHRVLDPSWVQATVAPLTLASFSAVDDQGTWHQNVAPETFKQAKYACGMFEFIAKPST